jgi:multidrug transporter EmrE-like cation transporter
MHYLLFATVLFRTCTDLCFKASVNKLHFHSISCLIKNIPKLIVTPFLWVAFILALINISLWSLSLCYFDLNYAYPFTSMSYVLIMIAGKIFFKEKLDKNKIIGIVFIAIGALFLMLG